MPAYPVDQYQEHGKLARVAGATLAIESNERAALADFLVHLDVGIQVDDLSPMRGLISRRDVESQSELDLKKNAKVGIGRLFPCESN